MADSVPTEELGAVEIAGTSPSKPTTPPPPPVNASEEGAETVSEDRTEARKRLGNLGRSTTVRSSFSQGKVKNAFQSAWTWGLQKILKHEATVESEEFNQMIKQFETSKLELADLLKWTRQLHESHNNTSSFGRYFSSSLAKLGSHSKAEKSAAESVQAHVASCMQLDGIMTTYIMAIHQSLVEPLKEIVETQIPFAANLLVQLQMDRLEMDSKLQKAKDLQDRPDSDIGKVAAQGRADACREQYEKTKAALTDACKLVESRKTALLTENLQEFVRAQLAYFGESKSACEASLAASDS